MRTYADICGQCQIFFSYLCSVIFDMGLVKWISGHGCDRNIAGKMMVVAI